MWHSLIRFLKVLVYSKTEFQLFTYFIPAPPQRKSGYREKELDSLFEQLTQLGFAITDLTTQSISSAEQSGLWVTAKLIPLTKSAEKIKVKDFPFDKLAQPEDQNSQLIIESNSEIEDKQQETVEGIYYID